MKNSKTRIMFIMCIAMAIMAIGYAYFATNLDITSTGNITTNWNVNFISITEGSNGGTTGSNAATPTYTGTTATMSANLQVPGDYMEYDLVLKNSGNVNAIIEDINAVATGSPAIIFSISGLNEGDKLAGGDSKTIKIKIEYDSSVTSQPSETTKTLTVSIKAVQDTGQEVTPSTPSIDQPFYLSNQILKDNVAQVDTNINFSAPSSDTNGKGLYYTNVNTEDGKTTYYFRGDVENNYVKLMSGESACVYNGKKVRLASFYVIEETGGPVWNEYEYATKEECSTTNVCTGSWSGDYTVGVDSDGCGYVGGTLLEDKATYEETYTLWRIVRINEDGSVRLITDASVGTSEFNGSQYGTNYSAYVGYMYGKTNASTYEETHTNTTNSAIKTYLEQWYTNNLSNYTNLISNEAGFCNDRSVAPEGEHWAPYDGEYYGPFRRITYPYTPDDQPQQFVCPQDNDLFTPTSSTKGNKKLTKPIGLLTADEAVYAGFPRSSGYSAGEKLYLTDDDGFWTMSPSEGSNHPQMFAISGSTMAKDYSYEEKGVRPVINLKADIGFYGGNGTSTTPYIIRAN